MGRAEERTNYILDRLAREGEVSVAQLASDLGVSPVTVRASLKVLDEQGYLVRTHGGARPTTFRNIHLRQNDRVDQKERIARAAADMIHDEFRAALPGVEFGEISRWDFYDAARDENVGIIVATGEQRLYGNLLLSVGVRQPGE